MEWIQLLQIIGRVWMEQGYSKDGARVVRWIMGGVGVKKLWNGSGLKWRWSRGGWGGGSKKQKKGRRSNVVGRENRWIVNE